MKQKRTVALAAAIAVAALLIMGARGLLGAPDTAAPWSVLGGGGGGTASSANFALGATAGQSAIGSAGSTSYDLGAGYWYGARDQDGDGLLNFVDPCPANTDCDGDGWTDWQEAAYITTNPLIACLSNGWPPDVSDNGSVQIDDVFFAASRFGQATGGGSYTPRAEIASQDGVIGIDDVFAFASRFNATCT